jgi:hypothetical protein
MSLKPKALLTIALVYVVMGLAAASYFKIPPGKF